MLRSYQVHCCNNFNPYNYMAMSLEKYLTLSHLLEGEVPCYMVKKILYYCVFSFEATFKISTLQKT